MTSSARHSRTGLARQLLRFALVGGLSTVVHLGLFAGFRTLGMPSAQVANLLALVLATVVNTALNRRWTFGVRGAGRARHHLQGFALLALNLGLTAGALGLLHAIVAEPATRVETLTVAGANLVATIGRFVLMRTWVFRAPADEAAELSTLQPGRTARYPVGA